jgi:hypothetical protein
MSGRLPNALRGYPHAKEELKGRPVVDISGNSIGKVKEAELPSRRTFTLQEVGFYAQDGLTGKTKTFTVLAGEGAPIPTEGWAKIAKVQRFQRVSLTVSEGYDPYVLSVPILFDAVALTKERPNVEADIETLEWMAGRTARTEAKGPPPQVQVFSTDINGNTRNMVPPQFQTANGVSQQWYITGIEFDPKPLKDRSGSRIRQAATVVLTEIVNTESQVREGRAVREAVKKKYRTVETTSAVNTIKRVALNEGFPTAWEAILKVNRNVTTDGSKHLRPGTKIRIPESLKRQVAK